MAEIGHNIPSSFAPVDVNALLLKHIQTVQVRFIHRQEKTLKLVSSLLRTAICRESLVWRPRDCSDGAPVPEHFALRWQWSSRMLPRMQRMTTRGFLHGQCELTPVEDAQLPSRFSSSGFRPRRVCRYLLKANATRHILAPLRTVCTIASRSREPLVRAKGAGRRWWRVAGCLRLAQWFSSVLESATPTTERPCTSA